MGGFLTGRCVIFCAGGFSAPDAPLGADDYVIAADGGVRHVEALGLTADAVLGDFDSLGYVPSGAQVFPAEKDDTDSMLAIRLGLSLGYREFVLYGALDGDRLEHTVSNFQALRYLCEHGARGTLVGLRQKATAVRNGSLVFPEECGGYLSLFCLGPDAEGVSLKGLKYEMENGRLSGSFPLGCSNRFTGKEATVTVEKGCLLAIWDRE